MRKTFDEALDEVLVPAITPLGFQCILNKDSRRCRDVVFTNGNVNLVIFYDIMDDVSISLRFVGNPMNGASYDEILKRMSGGSGDFTEHLGGWRQGGLWIPDFEKLFKTIAETLPKILQYPVHKLIRSR